MIPIRSIRGGSAQNLAAQVAADIDLVERGLEVIASSVPMPDGVLIDALVEDADGRIALLLVEDGPAEPLLERAARAAVTFRRTAPLLARLYPNRDFDSRETPRMILIARRFSETARTLLSVLRVPRLRCLECTVVDGAGGVQLAILSSDLSVLRDGGGCARPDREAAAPEDEPAQVGRPVPVSVLTAAGGAQSEPGTRAPEARNGELFDEMKQRLLRLSPDVIQEEDGDLVCFRVAGHLLARLRRRANGLRVAPGDDGAEEIAVEDEVGLSAALDAVFDRFFGLTPTRRRVAAADARSDEQRHGARRAGRANAREKGGNGKGE